MKIRHLLIGMLAIAGAVACKQEEPVEEPKLEVNKTNVAIAATAGEGAFEVTANNAWTAAADADWVSLDPASGNGGEKAATVKVTAEDNTATEARTATVTVKAGALTKTLKVTQAAAQGEQPGPGDEPGKDEVAWSMMGCFVDNLWSTDVPMTKEGEWIVAKGAQFTELTFKIRGNGSWDDATNIGRAPGSERAYVNDKIEVVTAEYAKANLGGDAADIKLDGEAGTYDVYFNFENLEVYVMEQGAKPGEKEPLIPEDPEQPEDPELQKSEWALVGSFNNWSEKSDLYLSVLDENYFVYYGFDMPAGGEFKFLKGGAWPDNGGLEVGGNGLAQPNTIQPAGGSNIKVNEAGKYDIYLAADLSKFYIMSEGKLPSEATEPAPVETTWGMMGCFVDNTWAKDVPMTKEGEWIVAKGAQFTELTFKIRANESWADATNIGVAPGSAKGEINTKVSVVTAEYAKANLGGDAADIKLNGEAGTYDVYFSYEKLEVYVMTPGLKPGETPAEPEPEYTLDGKQWIFTTEESAVLIDFGLFEEDAMVIAVPAMDNGGFACHMYGTYEIEKTDAKSGNIIFTQYDPEWNEFMEPVSYAYSELSESSVNLTMENVIGVAAPIQFNAVPEPYEISFDNLGGGEGPSGAIENGEYWFFNGEKVMAPLAEDVTTGTLPAGNVIDGASTVKNIFTFTYDPDMTYYTIQDSYGRYLGQTDETGNITVTDVLPTDETYGLYLWCIEPSYGGAYDIYNAAYYFDLTYSAANNNWVLVDGGYEFPETLPVLVKAENPVEEPVVPEGPKVVTAAEFNAATDNSIEYQVSGTISGIYQAYNSSYDNISLYISDETGEILAYRVSCAGITDPANTLTKGDLITVKGKRTLYNEKPQMAQGGVIVSHTDVVVETPAGGATLSFANKANRTVFTTSQQVWEQNGVKLINDKGSSTSDVADYAGPARFYKSSKITVEYAGMTKIEFTCNNGSYATALKNSITTGTVTVNGSVVTVELGAAADSYVISSLSGGQVRMDSLTVYTE